MPNDSPDTESDCDGEFQVDTITHNDLPYIRCITFQSTDFYQPIALPENVGDHVLIDWGLADSCLHDLDKGRSFRPPGVPDQRLFEITKIHHESYFEGFTIDDPSKTITKIFFDGRGGWTEVIFDEERQHKVHYSHPFLTFISKQPTMIN